MGSRLIIEGNAVYEIDEDCLRLQREKMEKGRKHSEADMQGPETKNVEGS